jgi:hypothetical protein
VRFGWLDFMPNNERGEGKRSAVTCIRTEEKLRGE